MVAERRVAAQEEPSHAAQHPSSHARLAQRDAFHEYRAAPFRSSPRIVAQDPPS